jgi:kinesin family protein 11
MQAQIQSQSCNISDYVAKIEAIEAEMKKVNELFTDTQCELENTHKNLKMTKQYLKKTAVERDEGEFLLEKHVRQESVLHGQASQLLGVVNESIADIDGLHGKLERKTGVDLHNKSVKESFKEEYGDIVTQMEANLATFQRKDMAYFSCWQENIGIYYSR